MVKIWKVRERSEEGAADPPGSLGALSVAHRVRDPPDEVTVTGLPALWRPHVTDTGWSVGGWPPVWAVGASDPGRGGSDLRKPFLSHRDEGLQPVSSPGGVFRETLGASSMLTANQRPGRAGLAWPAGETGLPACKDLLGSSVCPCRVLKPGLHAAPSECVEWPVCVG